MKRGVDYIGVGVGAIIVAEDGRVFLARRGPLAKNERGLWEFPGGSVEFGERLKDALRREIAEEYGIQIEVGELLDVVDHLLPDEGQHWVSPTFICRVTEGEPVIREPEKCDAIGWFRIEEIPANLSMVSRSNLAHYLRFLGNWRGETPILGYEGGEAALIPQNGAPTTAAPKEPYLERKNS